MRGFGEAQAALFQSLFVWTGRGSGTFLYFHVKHGEAPTPCEAQGSQCCSAAPQRLSSCCGEDGHPASDSQVNIFYPTEDPGGNEREASRRIGLQPMVWSETTCLIFIRTGYTCQQPFEITEGELRGER